MNFIPDMKVLKLILLLLLIFCKLSFAQTTIKGVVYEDGKPLAEAKVYLANHEKNHVLTNQNGLFVLTIPSSYQSQEFNKVYILPTHHKVRYSWKFNNNAVNHTRIVKINVTAPKDTTLVPTPTIAQNLPEENTVAHNNTEKPIQNTQQEQSPPPPIQNTPPPRNRPPVLANQDQTLPPKTSNNIPEQPVTLVENTNQEAEPRTGPPKDLDEVIQELKEVSKEIKGERQLIVEKHIKITSKLREITDALQNLNITQEQREKLLAIIDDLEQQLAENAVAYAELEKTKRTELSKLREKLSGQASTLQDIRLFLKLLLFILVLIIIILVIIYWIAQKRKQQRDHLEEKNSQIEEQNKQLTEQQQLINDQKRTIEERNKLLNLKNTQLTASIRYALNIQKSILPHSDTLKDTFKEHFVFYSPKDIVSGDFYWLHRQDNISVLAVVDCTGHGVPGGFMSIIGDSLLNEIVSLKGIHQPSKIIQELHKGIVERLNQSETKGIDGMDLGICLLEHSNNGKLQVTYAGAKNNMYYINNGSLQVLKGDRISIGGFDADSNHKHFTDETIILTRGDTLYLTTDGFIDNPNPKRQRFGRRKFQDLLEACSHLSMEEQEEKIKSAFEEHKEKEEQRDDILVLGVKV